jgi:glutamyl-Q tRNA(Asp) synthetase
MTDVDRSPGYIGRFAPSPTGDLHFGSLVAAVASFVQARVNRGKWVVRIEDIDPPREIKGSAERIVHDLSQMGMNSDDPVIRQSTRIEHYREIRNSLLQQKLAFHCSCSRKLIPKDGRYPGTCRNGMRTAARNFSTRLKVTDEMIEIHDGIQGNVRQDLAAQCGDFVIWRADGLPAYQLAVVSDDDAQGVTEVVRGADLLDSTARQIHLQNVLNYARPGYVHVPVATKNGRKLSKRDGADPVSQLPPADALKLALRFLGHSPPDLHDIEGIWAWSFEHWDLQKVPARETVELSIVTG